MRSAGYVAIAALCLAGCSGAEYPQFGQNSYRIEGLTTPLGGGAATHTIVFRKGPQMRVEAVLPDAGRATIVFDDATRGAYALNPNANTPRGVATPEADDADLVAVAALPGIAVRIEDADAPQPLETTWAALGADNVRSTGRCEVAGERGREWTPRTQTGGVERSACITADGIILRVTENGHVLWEATSLQRGEQDLALFGVPAGYRMVDPNAFAAREAEDERAVTPAQPRG